MTKHGKAFRILIGALAISLLAGCGSGAKKEGSETKAPANATESFDTSTAAKLSLYLDLGMSDEWLRQFIIDPVQKKFPNITIDIVRKQKGSNPDELVAAGTFPDILYNSTPRLTTYRDLNLLYDMRDLIKKYNVNVGSLNQPALDAIKQLGTKGEIYGLPLWVNFSVLYYNKDLFDKFSVPYPNNGMNWDETIELSKRLTRTDGGVTYRGLDIHDLNSFYSQLAVPFVDAKTDASMLGSDGFKKIFETMMKLYAIPGNQNRPAAKDAFLKDKTLAMWPMYADVPSWINDLLAKGDTFNWDMAQMPSFADKPGQAWQVDSHNLFVTSTSKNKDAAFMVVAYLLTQEPQLQFEKNGMLSALTDPELNKHFGESMTIFKGKNVAAIFKSKPAAKYMLNPYDSIVQSEFTGAFKKVESGEKNINTALAEANESANKKIQDKKSAVK